MSYNFYYNLASYTEFLKQQTIVTTTALDGKKKKLEADQGEKFQINILSNADVYVKPDNEDVDLSQMLSSQQAGHSLYNNFMPLDVELGNQDDLPDILLHPSNMKLVQRFVREWNREYEDVKSGKTTCTQRHWTKFWHADHIKPVWEGGGECDIDNLRTLCVLCHMKVTAEQAKKRAHVRRLSSAAGAGNITAFFQPVT
ncbi:hypothetical protein KUTeg_013573 [Tegillarca granosa]|uniref:HNH domain-containing protein n=1 Tax=Tegillarca granosa TaxID=220873 RepID=A0ABQ9EUF4_TEGGR|nr:hypothetical protein KUTeg_013573 [Tegillarca granosa]